MRGATSAYLLLAALSLGASSPVAAELVAVTRVIDGNTFEANGDQKGYLVRLAGVDQPILGDARRSKEAAASATQFLRCLVNRKAVELAPIHISADYDDAFTYANVWLGELFVNEVVVVNGYGQPASHMPETTAPTLSSAYEQAVREKRGVWAPNGAPAVPSCKDISTDPGAIRPPPSTPPISVEPGVETAADRGRARAERMRRRFDTKRWTVLVTTPDGVFGYDAKLTEREGPSRYTTWLRADYIEAQPIGEDEYHYSLDRIRIDCRKRVTQTVSTVKYNHQVDGTMKVVFSFTHGPGQEKSEPIVPESFGERLYGELCTTLELRFASAQPLKK